MSRPVPRMRMFAGPNGSGKSTIKEQLPPELVGVYVNPDEIEKRLATVGRFALADFQVEASPKEVREFFARSTLRAAKGRDILPGSAQIRRNVLSVDSADVDSYLSSVLADFIRRKLIASGTSFTFETVMSSPDKVRLLDEAKARGFRNYLYFIATDDPEINVSRVTNRVNLGGHPVPKRKVIERYRRSLGLLLEAIRRTDRAYVFDNSGAAPVWLAEVTNGTRLQLKTSAIPEWFQQAVLDRLQ